MGVNATGIKHSGLLIGNDRLRIKHNKLISHIDISNAKSYTGGNQLYDISGNHNNYTLINSPTYTADNELRKYMWCNSYDQINFDNFPITSDTVSVSAWLYVTTSSINSANEAMLCGFNVYSLFMVPKFNIIGYNTGNGDIFGTAISNISNIAINRWALWTFVFNTGTNVNQNKIYINDTNVAMSQRRNSPVAANANFNNGTGAIGDRRNLTGNYNATQGVATFSVYDRELSFDEHIYNFGINKGKFGL